MESLCMTSFMSSRRQILAPKWEFMQNGIGWIPFVLWKGLFLRKKMKFRWIVCLQIIMSLRSEMQFFLRAKSIPSPGWWHCRITAACLKITVIPCLMRCSLAWQLFQAIHLHNLQRMNWNMIMPGNMMSNHRVRQKKRPFLRIWWVTLMKRWLLRIMCRGLRIRQLILPGRIWAVTVPWWLSFFIWSL